ncbi:Protein of unknown function [Escherichia coli D6-117.29]|jgi:hypothetical protein
MNS